MKLMNTISFLSIALFSISTNATLFTGEIDEDAYVTVGEYDIAWASPCSDGALERSCSPIELTEQSQYGWNVMTSVLFNSLNLSISTFLVDYTSDNTQTYRDKNYAKASGWFTNYDHIDIGDGLRGKWSFADVRDRRYSYETMTYRTSTNGTSVNIPAPAMPVLFAIGLISFGFLRKSLLRKKSKV